MFLIIHEDGSTERLPECPEDELPHDADDRGYPILTLDVSEQGEPRIFPDHT